MMILKRTYLVIAVLMACGMVSQLSAQKMGRYHKNLLYEADIYFEQGDYYYAAELYTELGEIAPNDGEILGRIGICYYNLPTLKDQSVRYLQLATENGDTEALFYLSKSRIESYKFFEALDLINQYEDKADRKKNVREIAKVRLVAQRAIDMVQAPVNVSIENLGDGINSKMHDYAPVLDEKANRLYFTSRRRYDNESVKDVSEQFDENIFFIDLNSKKPSAMGASSPFNSRTNDATVACSKDGKSLIIYRTRKNGYSGDFHITHKSNYGWSELEKLDENINSKYQEASACFGNEEGTILYFSSDRPHGFGGKDLYMVSKLPNGKWSKAINLGPDINTPYDEDAPFISVDGSLYFSSNGTASMGGYDIFCAVNENGEFRKPENMGYPINTPGDDIFFVLDSSGKKAYFSSERLGGNGLQDIYRIRFEDLNTMIYKGKLVSLGEKIPPYATVTLLNDDKGTVEGLYQTNPDDGTFVLALNANQSYTVLVEADGYPSYEKQINMSGKKQGKDEIDQIILSK